MILPALTRFIATAKPPRGAEDTATPAIADCFGAILAGAHSEVAAALRQSFSRLGARDGDAAVFGTSDTLSPPYAALANAVAGHAWDLDDWEEPGNTHPTVVILPALLAAASIRDDAVTGREMLAAYCVGAEIIMRLGEAVSLSHYERGFHSTATLGTIGAAAAVARLLRLGEEEIAHALGFAASNAVGYTLQFGSHAKPLQAGWAARAGLEAACLAEQGLTSKPETLIHPRGFAGLMGVYDAVQLDAMAPKLGNPWALEEYGLILKPWPSCGYTHRMMTAAAALRPRLMEKRDAITAIHLTTIDFHYAILPYDTPQTREEALFSLPACTAQMLVHGALTLTDSENGFWQEARVKRLIGLTSVVAEKARNPDLNYDPRQPDIMRVVLGNGEAFEEKVAYPLGAAGNPLTSAQLAEKYHSMTHRPREEFENLLGWAEAKNAAEFFREAGHG